MADTEFKFFAQTLATKYKKRQKVEAFAESLFREIYLPEDEISPIDNTEPRTFRAYYYGQNDITALAEQIASSLDTSNFARFIETDSDDTIEYLCEKFSPVCAGISDTNYAQVIAQLFKGIIDRAASPKTKNTSLTVITGGGVPKVQSAVRKYGVFLVAEAGSICPNCHQKPLFAYGDGRNELVYDVVVIDPDESEDDINNLIALCPECAAKYLALKTSLDIIRMRDNKKALLDAFDNQDIRAEQHIPDGVRRVIDKIPSIQVPANADLNYDPATVRDKIEIDNLRLYLTVKTQVNVYFNDVHEAFQQLGRGGKLRFNSFCQQVKYRYVTFRDKGYDQDKIYYEMTKWLSDATGEAWGDCEVVISYFVQKCEVFDVITG